MDRYRLGRGSDKTGPYGPYKQSERLAIYRQWAGRLVDSGRAYADPYSLEQLAELRRRTIAAKKPFLFRDYRPDKAPPWDGRQALRFKSDPKSYAWHDEVMGDLSSGPEAVDDFILIKADGYPTYNFCHIVDDQLMQISHVIRSQEFISSIPKYLNLYEALGLSAPLMATLPYVMECDGAKNYPNETSQRYPRLRQAGYLPEAMINFLATLGWNDGSEQEIFSKDELIAKFRLDRVQKAGARFDEQRLLWLNGQWLRRQTIAELYERSEDFWPAAASGYDEAYKKQLLKIVQDRLKSLQDLAMLTASFFSEPAADISLINNNHNLKDKDKKQLSAWLEQVIVGLAASDFSVDDLTKQLNRLLEETGQPPAVLFSLVRIATTWAATSPGLAESLNLLGKERSLKRLRKTQELLA